MHNLWLRFFLNHEFIMIQAGKNITLKDDLLQKIKPEYLYHAISNPAAELDQKIRQLRTIATIDKAKYDVLKKQLPYVVCGIFNPAVRRTENFAWIQHFILDFDHMSEKGMEPEALKAIIGADSRVELAFISPGADGLKVMFMLAEKCFDRAKFSLFYKVFARMFSRQYKLDQVIDPRTSDTTRACFLSTDRNALFNPEPDKIEIRSFIDYENPLESKRIAEEISNEEKEDETLGNPCEERSGQQAGDLVLDEIKRALNPKSRQGVSKQIFVPHELEKTVELVSDRMKSLSIVMESVRDIHYGKKFVFSLAMRKAEINLFYGKRGFSVVISPKAGTDKELSEVCSSLLQELFVPGNPV